MVAPLLVSPQFRIDNPQIIAAHSQPVASVHTLCARKCEKEVRLVAPYE